MPSVKCGRSPSRIWERLSAGMRVEIPVGIEAEGDGADESVAARCAERPIAELIDLGTTRSRGQHGGGEHAEDRRQLGGRQGDQLLHGTVLAVGEGQGAQLVELDLGGVRDGEARAGGDGVGQALEGEVGELHLHHPVCCVEHRWLLVPSSGAAPVSSVAAPSVVVAATCRERECGTEHRGRGDAPRGAARCGRHARGWA